jgi:hypothetical protein
MLFVLQLALFRLRRHGRPLGIRIACSWWYPLKMPGLTAPMRIADATLVSTISNTIIEPIWWVLSGAIDGAVNDSGVWPHMAKNDVDIDGDRLTARNADVGLHSGQSLRLPMSTESQLREKLRKIEALFAGAGTAGERLAAEAALERVRARLGELSRQDPSIEMQFSMPDQWSRHCADAMAW